MGFFESLLLKRLLLNYSYLGNSITAEYPLTWQPYTNKNIAESNILETEKLKNTDLYNKIKYHLSSDFSYYN